MRNEFADRYLADKVTTASPAELIGMLYDAGLVAMQAAQAAIGARSVGDAHRHLIRAQDIVVELRCSLDLSVGELAGNLDSLCDFLGRRLVEANLRKDAAVVADCIRVFAPLRDGWREACLGRVPAPVA